MDLVKLQAHEIILFSLAKEVYETAPDGDETGHHDHAHFQIWGWQKVCCAAVHSL